jgi:hypothetical protein
VSLQIPDIVMAERQVVNKVLGVAPVTRLDAVELIRPPPRRPR